MKRYFYAIGFSRKTIGKIRQIIQNFCLADISGHYVRPENLHLTLQFIGDVSPDLLLPLTNVLQQTAKQQKPFQLVIDGLGTFGRRQDILWLGIQPEPQLDHLQRVLTSYLQETNLPYEERTFSPHITLARQARFKTGQLAVLEKSLPIIRQPVEEILLMESVSRAGRRCYDIIDRAAFVSNQGSVDKG